MNSVPDLPALPPPSTAARLFPGANDTTAPFDVELLPLFSQAGPRLETLAADLHEAAKELTQIGALPDLAATN